MKTIYITGFESIPELNGVSGWEWRDSKEVADTVYNDWLNHLTDCTLYRGVLEVSSELSFDEVTDFVQDYLDKHDYENAFEDTVNL